MLPQKPDANNFSELIEQVSIHTGMSKEEVIELSNKIINALKIEEIPDKESNSEIKNVCFKE